MPGESVHDAVRPVRTGLVSIAGAGLFLVACLAYTVRKEFNSDGAISSIIGLDIAAGNVLLKGWTLSLESYFTTDYLLHGLLAFFLNDMQRTGIAGVILILCLSFTAVLLTAKAASGKAQQYVYTIPVYMLFVIAMRYTTFFSPTHHATIGLSLLAAYLFFCTSPAGKWTFVLLAAFILIGDKYSLVYLLLPLLAETAVHSWRRRALDRRMLYLAPVFILAFLGRYVLEGHCYQVPGVPLHFAVFEKLPRNLFLYLGSWFVQPDAWFWGGSPASPKTLRALCFALLPAACVAAHMYFRRSENRHIRFLCLSSLCVSGAFIFSSVPVDLDSSRYLIGVFFNGIILIAVFMATRLPETCRRAAAACSLLLPAVFLVLALVMPANALKADNLALAKALVERNLRYGYADYWPAHAVTFESGGAVGIAPIAWYGEVYGLRMIGNKKDWYTSRPATFVVRDDKDEATRVSFDAGHIRQGFGEAREVFRVGERWTVYVFDTDLQERLGPRPAN